LRDKEPGWALEAKIRQALVERVSFDIAAKDALYVLDRCSGGLYLTDVALVRNREAAAYFGPAEGQALLRRPVEYYRSLVNLGASLICNARYEEARDVYEKVGTLVGDYDDGVFPRIDYPRMNGLLAEYRMGVVQADEAAERQRDITISCAVADDPFYVENALAVYLALAGLHDDALAIFDRLDSVLTRSRREPEPSMTYLIRSNRCATRFVSGDVQSSQDEWASLAVLVDRIAYTSRPMYVRRHELLARVIGEGARLSASAFDEALLVRYPEEFGPLWDSFGRGFTLPAIEFWREN
jgi:tetratricopeptide (TPR) repeat protein